jgi:hypothetical protein
LWRKSLIVKPQMLMYPRRMALRKLRVVLGREAESARDVGSERRLEMGGRDGGVDREASYRWG